MARWVLAAVAALAGCVPAGGAAPAAAEAATDVMPAVRFELVGKVEERPVLVTHDGLGRTFIVEQVGRIWLLKDGKLPPDAKPFLDISDKVYSPGECGLLGLAFHPKFVENGYFYVNYTAERFGEQGPEIKQGNKTVRQTAVRTVIAEFTVEPGLSVASPLSERLVMAINQPFENHNGGMIAFGPDGMLYVGMGDGGGQRDPLKNGQNLSTLLGKMLRIDVSPREGFATPKDNPFVGKDNARPEIWALGLRNPWRFSFDRETGHLYAADVGEDRWEEIDLIERGGNYGWSVREGAYPFIKVPVQKGEAKPLEQGPAVEGFKAPIKAYWHDLGMSVTGGNVYRGKAIPGLRGWYLYGDYSKGTIWGLKYENGKVVAEGTLKIENEKEVRPMLPSGFGEDTAGEIYVCSHQDGKVWRIVPAAAAK